MSNDLNDPLEKSNAEFKDLRLRLRQLPFHRAPTSLLNALKHDFIGPSWKSRFVSMFAGGPIFWKPLGAVIAMALIAGVWLTRWKTSENNLLDLDPLVTAHARYQSESMLPPGDLANSGFGFHLASYYGEEN